MDDDVLGELVDSGDEGLSDGFMDELLGSDDLAGDEGGVGDVPSNDVDDVPSNNDNNDTPSNIPSNYSLTQEANHRKPLAHHSSQ